MNAPENTSSTSNITGTAPAVTATPTFADVRAILNNLTQNCNPERMKAVHNAPNFGWETVEQLKNVVVQPYGPGGGDYPLIDMDLVRQGQGDQTNLVVALASPTGVDYNGQMPRNPPARRYATKDEVATIVAWLNAGLPE